MKLPCTTMLTISESVEHDIRRKNEDEGDVHQHLGFCDIKVKMQKMKFTNIPTNSHLYQYCHNICSNPGIVHEANPGN